MLMVHPRGSVKLLISSGAPRSSTLTLSVVGSVAAELVVDMVMRAILPHALRNVFRSVFA